MRLDRSLHHIDNPIEVVKEMERVARKDGVILCAEPDWGTFSTGTALSTMTKAIQDRWVSSFKNPWIGRNLFGMMKAAGMGNLSIEGHLLLTEGFETADLVFDIRSTTERLRAEGVSEASLSTWLDDYQKNEALAGVTLVVCYGRKHKVPLSQIDAEIYAAIAYTGKV